MKEERGFALLFVIAFSFAIAILLYTELPRVVFEAQRSQRSYWFSVESSTSARLACTSRRTSDGRGS